MTETLDNTISVEVLKDRREEIYDRIGYLKQIISQFPAYSTPTIQQELVEKTGLLRLYDEKISNMTTKTLALRPPAQPTLPAKPALPAPAQTVTPGAPTANLHNLPQGADKNPPDGYHILRAGAWREAGDLVYTVAGWIVCNITSGNHPEGGLYCRKIIQPSLTQLGERRFAPLRFMKKDAFFLQNTTPLFYISNVPFAQSAEEDNKFDESRDEDMQVHQMHELKAAVARMNHEKVDFGSLILVYLDHAKNAYDHIRLMWIDYEEPPDDGERTKVPVTSPAGHPERVRVVKDPYGLCVF